MKGERVTIAFKTPRDAATTWDRFGVIDRDGVPKQMRVDGVVRLVRFEPFAGMTRFWHIVPEQTVQAGALVSFDFELHD